MNSSHSEDGWCLDCVKELHDEKDGLLERIAELEALFDLQWTRTVEADAAYVAAHPREDCPHGYKPDLGRLIGWLMEEAGLKERSE